jgi:hypothetical protein
MGVAAFLLAFTVAAWAQAPRPAADKPAVAAGGSTAPRQDPVEARRLFRQLDRNGDGCLAGDELKRGLGGDEPNWLAVDRNRDGRITPEEFTVIEIGAARR